MWYFGNVSFSYTRWVPNGVFVTGVCLFSGQRFWRRWCDGLVEVTLPPERLETLNAVQVDVPQGRVKLFQSKSTHFAVHTPITHTFSKHAMVPSFVPFFFLSFLSAASFFCADVCPWCLIGLVCMG